VPLARDLAHLYHARREWARVPTLANSIGRPPSAGRPSWRHRRRGAPAASAFTDLGRAPTVIPLENGFPLPSVTSPPAPASHRFCTSCPPPRMSPEVRERRARSLTGSEREDVRRGVRNKDVLPAIPKGATHASHGRTGMATRGLHDAGTAQRNGSTAAGAPAARLMSTRSDPPDASAAFGDLFVYMSNNASQHLILCG
jgi:hypothetical protein